MKILLVEDDQILASNLQKTLQKEGFTVELAPSKEDGLTMIEINEFDCVVLDIGLPDGNGFELLEEVRTSGNQTPVVIVTARGQVEDRIKGLNLGADDYVPKPVDSEELIARIRAMIRRNSMVSLPVIQVGDLVIKPAEHKATVNEYILELTAKEFSVLEYLGHHSGQVVTRTMLMEHIWGSEFDAFSNVIDVYIRNLRRKLEEHSSKKLIKTIRGKGYILGDS